MKKRGKEKELKKEKKKKKGKKEALNIDICIFRILHSMGGKNVVRKESERGKS